jgi:dTDP-4-dehydrorhamnose 3,5-epimerase
MELVKTVIPGVLLLRPQRVGDDRGFMSETFRSTWLEQAGILTSLVQDNHSYSEQRGTVRGLHFQVPPRAQDKLVRVVRGSVLDVAVDLRKGSPCFGHHVAVVLSADNWEQVFIPHGFAHGFCTLEPHTEVLYKVSDYYSAEHEAGLLWNDPALGISWPVRAGKAILSERDRHLPGLAELPDWFHWEE